MSDSGVWGIAQEYFDKVYPEQEKRRRKNFRVSVLTEPKGEARDSTTFNRPSVTKAESRGAETPLLPNFP